jgi:hypothetical protein
VFFPLSDSGMTGIKENKLLISKPRPRKGIQNHKVPYTYNIIPHVFLANMTVEERRRYATVTGCRHLLYDLLKGKEKSEFKQVHLLKRNFQNI